MKRSRGGTTVGTYIAFETRIFLIAARRLLLVVISVRRWRNVAILGGSFLYRCHSSEYLGREHGTGPIDDHELGIKTECAASRKPIGVRCAIDH